jgi:hypothetical protein
MMANNKNMFIGAGLLGLLISLVGFLIGRISGGTAKKESKNDRIKELKMRMFCSKIGLMLIMIVLSVGVVTNVEAAESDWIEGEPEYYGLVDLNDAVLIVKQRLSNEPRARAITILNNDVAKLLIKQCFRQRNNGVYATFWSTLDRSYAYYILYYKTGNYVESWAGWLISK